MSNNSNEVARKSLVDIICERTGANKVPFMYEVNLQYQQKDNQTLERGNINESSRLENT